MKINKKDLDVFYLKMGSKQQRVSSFTIETTEGKVKLGELYTLNEEKDVIFECWKQETGSKGVIKSFFRTLPV